MEDIKVQLMTTARIKGICADGYSFMRGLDLDRLVTYYLTNPDWCMERDFPTLDFLEEHFSDCQDRGIYIHHTFDNELLDDKQTYIFHNCRGTIRVGLNIEKAIIPMLYFGNRCDMKIVGTGIDIPELKGFKPKPSSVPLYIFGDNHIKASDNKFVKFTKFKEELI